MTLPTTTNTPDPAAQGLDVQIGTTYFRLVGGTQAPMEVRTAPKKSAQAPPDTSLNPEDFDRDEGERVFSQVDFSGGEGLEQIHRRDQVDNDKRFWLSSNMEVYDRRGEPAVIRAAREVEELGSLAGDGAYQYANAMTLAYNTLWFVAADKVGKVVNPTQPTPAFTFEDPDTGSSIDIQDVTTLNGTLYAAGSSNGIYTRNSLGTWSTFNTVTAHVIEGLKGRLVVANTSGNLYEIVDATVPSPTISLGPNADFTCFCDGGDAILAGTDDGVIYALADNNGVLVNRGQTVFEGEVIIGMAQVNGLLGIVTLEQGSTPDTARFYTAQLGGSYTLTNIDLIREFDAATAPEPMNIRIAAGHDAFWLHVIDESTGNQRIFQYRHDTGGLMLLYEHNKPFTTYATGLMAVEDMVFWTVDQSAANVFLFRNNDIDRASPAYLITGLADHFDAKEKQVIGARLYCHQVPSGTTAKLYVTTNPDAITDPNHASWTLVVTRTSVDDSEELVSGLSGRWIAAKVELTTTDPTVTAEVRGFSIRSYQTERDVELVLPIDASDTLHLPGRRPVRSRGRGQEIYDHLQSLEGGAVDISMVVSGESWRGNVLEVSTARPVVDEHGIEQLACVVRFRGRRL